MVSPTHEVPHVILQDDPASIAKMLEFLGIPVAPVKKAAVISPDATEAKVLERHIDAVLRIETDTESFLVAVEVQSRPVESKWSTWLYYCAYLQEKLELPTALLIICLDAKVAAWASRGRSFGPLAKRTAVLTPVVCGPRSLPRFLEREQIVGNLPLAALSLIAHASEPDAERQMSAFAAELEAQAEEEGKFALADLISAGLSGTQAARLWSRIMLMDTSYPRSPLAQALADQVAREVARETAIKDGTEKVIRALELQSKPIAEADRQRILECTDIDTLDHWFERTFTVAAASELFDES